MKTISSLLFFIMLLLMSTSGYSNILIYPFEDSAKEQRFNQLIQELRCPKCQNNNLADSNSPLAVDLKDIVYEKINAGESDEQIISYLKERYGDFISYRPPLKPSTWLIWFGPFIFLIAGIFVIFRFVANRGGTKEFADRTVINHDAKEMLSEWRNEVNDISSNNGEKNND